MKKEEWLAIRENTVHPVNVWFAFYKEMGGTMENMDEFGKTLQSLISEGKLIIGKDGNVKRITSDGALRKMKAYYDAKFVL